MKEKTAYFSFIREDGRVPNCVQYGVDGFGHQLEGTFGLVAMHICGKINYVFDLPVDYSFAHENVDETCVKYMQYAMQKLSQIFPTEQELNTLKTEHVRETWKIPKDFKDDIIYSLDNAFYEPLEQLEQASDVLKKAFRANPYLPTPSYDLTKNNIVVHIRLGDAWLRRIPHEAPLKLSGKQKKSRVKEELNTLYKMLSDYQANKNNNITIHTDGDISIRESENLKIFNKNTHVLQVLSDFIHAKTLVLSYSSLGLAATWLADRSIELIPPDHLNPYTKKTKTQVGISRRVRKLLK